MLENVGKTLGFLLNKSKCSFIFVSFREGVKYYFAVPAIAVDLLLILLLLLLSLCFLLFLEEKNAIL